MIARALGILFFAFMIGALVSVWFVEKRQQEIRQTYGTLR